MYKLTDFLVEPACGVYNVYWATDTSSGPLAVLPNVSEAARFVRALVDERL